MIDHLSLYSEYPRRYAQCFGVAYQNMYLFVFFTTDDHNKVIITDPFYFLVSQRSLLNYNQDYIQSLNTFQMLIRGMAGAPVVHGEPNPNHLNRANYPTKFHSQTSSHI